MKPALYMLCGVAAVLAFGGLVVGSVWLALRVFGEVWGLGVWGLTLMTLGGGMFGWLAYRLRNPR